MPRERALELALGAWIHGHRDAERHVAARMPAKCVSLFLLLAWICAVPEARAKSLADEGALGKPCGGMQHNEEMGVVLLFYGFFFFLFFF